MPRPDQNKDIASVRRQAAEVGLTFAAYLPPALAEWVIGLVEHKVFHSCDAQLLFSVQLNLFVGVQMCIAAAPVGASLPRAAVRGGEV
jgi:hypothetical protein